GAAPILFAEFGQSQRVPQFLGRRADEGDVDKTGIGHGSVPDRAALDNMQLIGCICKGEASRKMAEPKAQRDGRFARRYRSQMLMTLPTLPTQAADTPWPTEDWPEGPLDGDASTFRSLVARAFGEARDPQLGETHALVAIHRGRLVAEHYAKDFGPEATCPS